MRKEDRKITYINKKIQRLSQSYVVVVMPQGLGDILYFCLYLKHYKREHSTNKIAFIVTKKHFRDLANFYKNLFDKIIYIDAPLLNKVDNSRLVYYYPQIYNENNPQEHLMYAVKQGIGVDINSTPYYPTIYVSRHEKRIIGKIISKPGRTILISPEAVSCSVDISEKEWIDLADTLREKGMEVYFNTNKQEMYGNYPKIFFSLRKTLIFTHYAGYFIGFRSGLCDVVAAFSDCKQIIIYPNNKKIGEFPSIKNFDINPNEKYMDYCSLKKAFPDRTITEFIYKKGQLLNRIEREFRNGEDLS